MKDLNTKEIMEYIDNNNLGKFKEEFNKQTAATIYAVRNSKDFENIIELALKNENEKFLKKHTKQQVIYLVRAIKGFSL